MHQLEWGASLGIRLAVQTRVRYFRVRSAGWIVCIAWLAVISTGCRTPLRRAIAAGSVPHSVTRSEQSVDRASTAGQPRTDQTVVTKKKAAADEVPGAAPAESPGGAAAAAPPPRAPWTVTTITHSAPPVATTGSTPGHGRARALPLRRTFTWVFVPALAVLAGLVVILTLSSNRRISS